MRTPFIVRVPDDALGRDPASYEELLRLAARYARDHLAGQTLFNQETRLCITLTPEALRAATQYGTSTALLRALPAFPAIIEGAGYVRSSPDRRPLVNIREVDLRDTRRVHLLGATAEVAGWLVRLLFTVRENFGGQCFLDRATAPHEPDRRRQDGGGAPDDVADPAPSEGDDTIPPLFQEQPDTSSVSVADAGTPKLSARDKAYLDNYYDLVNETAKKYFVDPALVLGVGAESGFGTSHIFQQHRDAFGMSGGSIGTQPDFPSYAANVKRFFSEYGLQIWGVGGDAGAFINALAATDAAGNPVPGWKKYNTEHFGDWLTMIRNGIPQMRRSVPLYLQQRDRQ